MSASPFQAGDKVVAYCRYSEGDEQGLKNQSTEEQEAAIRKFCETNKLELVRVFADPFASGRSVAKRDHYLEMLSFLLHKKKPDVQGVVLWDFERYGRNYDQAQLDAAKLRMAGYKLFSLQQPITDDGPFAKVLEAMYFASAQNQSDMISADVKRALQYNFKTHKVIPRSSIGWGWVPEPVQMGYLTNGTPRIGYRAVPDPDKKDLIKQAVIMRLGGSSLTDCRYLLGMTSNWKVSKLFANPLLYGQMTYGETTMEDYCEPIVSKEEWTRLQVQTEKIRTRKPGKQGGWSAKTPMLSGMLYCAECGGPMYLYRRVSKGHLYERYYCEDTCFPGIKKDKLEELVIKMVTDALVPEKIEEYRSVFPTLWEGSKDERESRNKDIAVRIGELNEQIENAVNAITHGLYSDALALRLQSLESEKNTLEASIGNVDEQTNADTLYTTVARLSKAVRETLLSDADDATKKTALETCVQSILINAAGKVQISMYIPGTSPHVGGEYGKSVQAPPEGVTYLLQLVDYLIRSL